MFKVGMALVFSVIAALVVFLTGMFGDARVTTMLLRSLIAFISSHAVVRLYAGVGSGVPSFSGVLI